MGELQHKFELLDEEGKRQLLTYLDFLLLQKKKKPAFDVKAYRENLLKIPVWSEEELAIYDEVRQHINNWKVKEW